MKIGDRVRFKREITESATGDHPAFLLACKHEIGVVQAIAPQQDDDCMFPFLVKPYRTGPAFYANENDFVVL